MYIPTQRNYENKFSGEMFRLYQSYETGKIKLLNESTGEESESFYICAFSGVTVRFKDKTETYLDCGQFIPINKSNPVTHKKYIGFKKFTKI